MKKLVLFLVLFSLVGCATFKSKRDKTTDTKLTEKTETVSDSSSIKTTDTKTEVETVAPIEKETGISLRTADSIANRRINEALRNFRFVDRSGGNSVAARYDEKTMQLFIEAFVAQTKNSSQQTTSESETSTNKETDSEKSFEQQIDEYLEKQKIPWWVYGIALFFLRRDIVSIVGFFVPGVRSVQTFRDLFKSKSSER
jgi:hypothetical protein